MVSPHKRKPGKLSGTRDASHAVSVQIRKNIPFNKSAVVTRTQATRKVKRRVVTKSTPVVVPIPPYVPPGGMLPDWVFSDQTDPQTSAKEPRKGPSRSVAVRILFLT